MSVNPKERFEQLNTHRTSIGAAENDTDYRIILNQVLMCTLMRNSTKDRPAQPITLGNKTKHEMLRDICLECIDYLEQDLLDEQRCWQYDHNSEQYAYDSALHALNGIGKHAYLAMKDAKRVLETNPEKHVHLITSIDDEINRFHTRLDRIDKYGDM